MHEGAVFIIALAILTAGITITTLGRAWLQSRRPSPIQDGSSRLDAIEVRLSRMEESIESIAVEMERVAEGQRFTAKVLTDRVAPAAAPSLPGRPSPQPEGRATTSH